MESLPIYPATSNGIRGINATLVKDVSEKVKKLLTKNAPNLVSACDSFCSDVTYLPVSPMGCSPEQSDVVEGLGVRPQNLRPAWAEVPLLYAISKAKCDLVPELTGASAT
mgnify:CR=1 FL=1